MNLKDTPKHTIQYPTEKSRYHIYAQNTIFSNEYYEIFREQVKIALSKFTSSVKTRTVYNLLDNNIPILGIIQTDIIYSPPVAVQLKNTNEISSILINNLYIDDTNDGSLFSLVQKIGENLKNIRQEKKVISDLQIYKLEKLEEEKRELQEKFRHAIDWLKVVDLIYFGYLEALSYIAVNKNNPEKIKIFKVAEELVDALLTKILLKIDRSLFDDPITKSNYRLALQFFILTYFLQINKKEAIRILSEHKGEWVEAALENFLPESDDEKYETPYDKEAVDIKTIEKRKRDILEKKEKLKQHYDNLKKDLSKLKIEKFDDIVTILHVLDVINMNKNVFNNYMENMVSKEVYALYFQNYFRFIALMANLNYRTQIFPKLFDIDKTYQKRMEELILNQKRKVIIKPQKILFI